MRQAILFVTALALFIIVSPAEGKITCTNSWQNNSTAVELTIVEFPPPGGASGLFLTYRSPSYSSCDAAPGACHTVRCDASGTIDCWSIEIGNSYNLLVSQCTDGVTTSDPVIRRVTAGS